MNHREYLYSLERFGVKLGLENIRTLLEGAGNPHERQAYVHVAGTNGKGAVLAFLDAILREAGYRTGRYTSPHLIDLTERFLINRVPVADGLLDRQIARFRSIAEGMDPPPTFFELATAAGLGLFAEEAVDIALIEVGMGGRFDATNIIAPQACAITTIDLDHQAFLGGTLEAIAFEKAGILKPGVPCVLGRMREGPRHVIEERAGAAGAPLRILGSGFDAAWRPAAEEEEDRVVFEGGGTHIGPVRLGVAGRHQADNAAVALALAQALQPAWPSISTDAMIRGLGSARWPCRFERVLEEPPVYIDVAHNPAGARALAAQLPPCIVLAGFSEDKDIGGILEPLAAAAREFIFCPFEGRRSCPLDRIAETAAAYPHRVFLSLEQALEFGLRQAGPSAPLVITGSVFLAGQARQWLCEHRQAPPLGF